MKGEGHLESMDTKNSSSYHYGSFKNSSTYLAGCIEVLFVINMNFFYRHFRSARYKDNIFQQNLVKVTQRIFIFFMWQVWQWIPLKLFNVNGRANLCVGLGHLFQQNFNAFQFSGSGVSPSPGWMISVLAIVIIGWEWPGSPLTTEELRSPEILTPFKCEEVSATMMHSKLHLAELICHLTWKCS